MRKLTTRPVWYLEKHWPRIWRKSWRKLPAVASHAGGPSAIILGTQESIDESVWAAWTLARHTQEAFEITLYVDRCEAIDPAWTRAIGAVIGHVRIVAARPFLMERFGQDPVLGAFLRLHPMATKLLLLLAHNEEGSVLYMDNDVLFFQDSAELRQPDNGQPGCRFIQDIGEGSWDPHMLQVIQKRQLKRAIPLNGGLLWAEASSLSRTLARDLVQEGWDSKAPIHWFTEQTINSALFGEAGAIPLPRETYVVSNQRQFYFEKDVDYDHIICRHFSGPVRHLMYHKAYPRLLKKARQQ